MVELLITYGLDARGLAARILGQSAREFMRSIPWRIGMFEARAALDHVTDDALVFSESLSYKQCQNVVASLCGGKSEDLVVTFDESYKQFIELSVTFIEERSHVGLAIKSMDPALGELYLEFKSIVDSIMERKLRDRQMRDAFFMASVGWAANFSVPGAGKTAATLGSYCYLRHRDLVDRIVVVCPKSAFESWKAEWFVCFGGLDPQRCFCLGDPEIVRLSRIQKKRTVELDSGSFELMLFNYEALGNYTRELSNLVAQRTLLVFDEVHRVKAIGGQRAEWALEISERAPYVTVLTGTPIPNTYKDIYNFLHILYPRDYDTFFGFDQGFLNAPNEQEIEEINDALRPFFCRTSKDELGVPRANPDQILQIKATEPENRLMHILKAAYRTNPLALIIRTLQLASDPAMLKRALDPADFEYVLDQVGEDIEDIDFVNYSDGILPLINSCDISVKMAACELAAQHIVSSGHPVIIWCIFVHSIERITRELNEMGIRANMICGSTPFLDRENILNEFRLGITQVLVTNPHTLSESVSLHQVCHDAIYFEYSYNLVHLLQSKDRIHRLGLSPDQRTQYCFLQTVFKNQNVLNPDIMVEDITQQKWSLDENIYVRLREKEDTMLKAIDQDYLECGYLDDDDIRIVLGDLFDL